MSRWCSTSPWLLKHVCESVSARHLLRYINKNPLSSNITSNAPSPLCLINASSFLRYSNITHLSSLSVWFLWIFYSFHLSFYNSPPLRPHPFHSTVLNRLFFLVLHMLFLLSTWLSLSLRMSHFCSAESQQEGNEFDFNGKVYIWTQILAGLHYNLRFCVINRCTEINAS